MSFKSIVAIGILTSAFSQAAMPAICLPETAIFFVNGIQNTLEEAKESAEAVKNLLDISNNRSGIDKRAFTVDLIYNPIGYYRSVPSGSASSTDGNFRQDIIELFLEKTAEEHFSADFQRLIYSHTNASSRAPDKAAAVRVVSYIDNFLPGSNYIEANGLAVEADFSATKDVIDSLTSKLESNDRSIVVAHSQGNLIANLAWAKFVATSIKDVRRTVRVINVANTSRFSVNSLNLTHYGDNALYALKILPSASIPDWVRTTPLCVNSACDFRLAAPTMYYEGAGHGFVDTYLSDANTTVIAANDVQFMAGNNRFADRFEDLVYTAAESLDKSRANGVSACVMIKSVTCTRETLNNGGFDVELTRWKVSGFAKSSHAAWLWVGPSLLTSAGFNVTDFGFGVRCQKWTGQTIPGVFTCARAVGEFETNPQITEFSTDVYGDKDAHGIWSRIQSSAGAHTDWKVIPLSCPGTYSLN